MKKIVKPLLSLTLAATMLLTSALAVSYDGANTISSSATQSGKTYESTTAGQNALLVTGGTSTVTNPTVKKSGSPSGSSDDYDFYGTNAAILVSGGTLTLSGGTVTTDGSYANAVYAHGNGRIDITDTTIKTSKNNSGGVMVTGGGTLNASNVTVTTSGGSSAAIRSDKGGGMLTVTGGSFTTSGSGSPAIYSTADITVNDATLTSTSAEGVVVEGGNSVTLNNTTLTDTNATLNGQSTTYKNVFLYQSMSGDASSGGGRFTAKDSTITTNKGDSFFVTNNTATITLTNNTIVNHDAEGYFLRAQAGAWGRSGSNGGAVTLTLDDQDAEGEIYIDSISTLNMTLQNGSHYTGAINSRNNAKSVALTLSADSTLTLTGDTYVTSLTNADSTGSNIIKNGYTLTVGAAVTGTDLENTATGNTGAQGGGQMPPDMPNGQTPPDRNGEGGPGSGQTPPDMGNGQPPEKPDEENGSGQTPPAMPEGQTPPDMQNGQPPAMPNGESAANQTPPVEDKAEKATVVLSPQKLTVDGKEQKIEAYNINNTNYFKIRDLAALLNGTSSQFNVEYDAARNTVVLTTGKGYSGKVGTDFRDNSTSAVRSPQRIEIDGRSVDVTAYNIGNTNFFGLRALSGYLNYNVDYDAATNTAVVTSK